MAPSASDSPSSGTTSSGSKYISVPRPSQAGQAPKGLLKENSRGSISSMVKPETGQANFAENVVRSPVSASSAKTSPSLSSSAVSRLSAKRPRMPGRTTRRSTTTSMSCLRFLSSAGAWSISYSVPSTSTRWKPRFCRSASSFLYSPLRPRTTGASNSSRRASGMASVRSTIWLTVWLSIGRPVAGECGTPTRAHNNRI